MEQRLNERLHGYAVTLRRLDFHIVGGSVDLLDLENAPREEVATKATVSGRIDNPQTSTAETIVRLIQNAFFQAIFPGFDRIRRA